MITTRDIVLKTGLCIPTILMAIRYLFGDHKVVKGKFTNLTVDEANQVLGHLRFKGNVTLFTEQDGV